MSDRRIFLKNLTNMAIVSAAAVTAGMPVLARADMPLVSDTDPQAKAMGYVSDTSKADQKKFPKHTVAQKCNNCQLFQGKEGDAQGPCPLFAGKAVAGNGWCSAYMKKA
ncbi:iron permease [Oxalobacteraceae bacterium CAVE-383]|nr:iron permease [Oxalobacteraceae bacterium CAVE-383]